MAISTLPVIKVVERGASVYVTLPPGYPTIHTSFVSWLQGRRREWKPVLHAYRLPAHRAAALRAWLEGQVGVEIDWRREGSGG